MAGADAFLETVDHLAFQLGQVVVLAVLGQLAGIFRFVRVTLPVADDLLHRQVAGQVLVECVHPAAEKEQGALLVGPKALVFQIVERYAAEGQWRVTA